MNNKTIKRLLITLAALSVLLIFIARYSGPPPEVEWVSPQMGMQGSQLTAKGNVTAELEHDIRAKTEGYLDGFDKEAGDSVGKGELLGQIVSTRTNDYALQIAQLESSLQTQRVERKIAVENHERLKRGQQEGVVSGNEVLEARQKLELTNAGLRSIERELASVKQLNAEIERAAALNRDLKSIANGLLTEKYVANGEWIEKGKLLGRIVTVDKLKIKAFLLPDDARKLSPGDRVSVSDGNVRNPWQERVLQISPVINKTEENNHLQEVVISSDNAPERLQINTKLNLEFKNANNSTALTLPLETVFKRNGHYQIQQLDLRGFPGFTAVTSQRGIWAGFKHLACGIAPCETRFVRLRTRQLTTGESSLVRVTVLKGLKGDEAVVIPNAITQQHAIVSAPRP